MSKTTREAVLTVTLNPALDKTITIERFEYGGLNRIHEQRVDAGGKGINVAKVLRHFDVNVTAAGLTAGFQGGVLRKLLQQQGIVSSLLEAAGETRTNLKLVDESTRQTTELNEPGFHASPELLQQFREHYLRQLSQDNTAIVVLGGSLPPGAPADYYGTLIQAAKRQQVRTVLDADGEALRHGIEAAPFAVKPNLHELEAYFDRTFTTDAQLITAARELIHQGIEYVAVSMGGEGSLIVNKSEALRARPFPITPVSTVGAGDSMVAALVYGFMHRYTMEELARWSSAAGTITASKPGTQVCTLQEVLASIHQVEITAL